ncbi:tetratricopeptide repeat protein [candidate division KSB1 bacterium]|nr:tetratricopeptide repeat protein [candidate division KSB1 bacterium]
MKAKRLKIWWHYCLLIWWLFSLANLTSVYSQNKAAEKWYLQGQKATQTDEKMTFFQKALALDPSYTEAYYELGVIYSQKAQLDQAMHYLGRALFSRPGNISDELRFKIVLQIGQIQTQLNRHREARESLSGALNLTKDPAQRIKVLTVLIPVLLATEDYEPAIARYHELSRLDPQNLAQYQKGVEKTRQIQELDQEYQKGVQLLKNRRFKNAIETLQQVAARDSNFKDVTTNLRLAQQELAAAQRKEREFAVRSDEFVGAARTSNLEKRMASEITSAGGKNLPQNMEQTTFQTGMENFRKTNWDAAIKSFETVLSINPDNLEAANQLKLAQNALEQKMQNRLVESYYQEGLTFLRRRDWMRAMVAFEKVLNINPRHRQARASLQQAQTGLELAGANSTKQRYYEQGMLAIRNEDWILAETLLKRLTTLDPKYQDVATQLKNVQTRLAQSQQISDLLLLYQEGEGYLRNAKWLDAILTFQKVQAQNPNFRDVQLKLHFAQEQHEKTLNLTQKNAAKPTSRVSTHLLWMLGTLLGIVLLVSLFFMSPGLRGRVYLFLGQEDRASKLYERLLDQGTINDKLCLALLHLYLLENRRDRLAVKVYERVMRLNLLAEPQKAEAVSAIITQQYLNDWEIQAQQLDKKIDQLLDTNPNLGTEI